MVLTSTITSTITHYHYHFTSPKNHHKKIYVGNLNFSTTEKKLEEIFADYGEVKKVQIVTDRETGQSRGFGFVEMETADEENAAIDALDGAEYEGRTIKVNKARPRSSSPGRGSPGRGSRGRGRY